LGRTRDDPQQFRRVVPVELVWAVILPFVGHTLESLLKEQMSDEYLAPEIKEYLVILHEVIASYHERLVEVTSEKVANQLLGNVADKIAAKLELENKLSPIEAVGNLLHAIGMKTEVVKIGEQHATKLTCPLAQTIHPPLIKACKHHVCPAAIIALGAHRMADRTLQVANVRLTADGTNYTIRSHQK
jgi:hypothetical protein